MVRFTFCLFAVMAAFATASAALGASPLPEGRYCLKEEMVKDWDGGPPQLGHFNMYLKVAKRGGSYSLSLWNARPFAGPILEASTGHASLLSDGSLEFRFVDGWGNEGRALVHSDGKVALSKMKSSLQNADAHVPDENYGTFHLTPEACADQDFARYR